LESPIITTVPVFSAELPPPPQEMKNANPARITTHSNNSRFIRSSFLLLNPVSLEKEKAGDPKIWKPARLEISHDPPLSPLKSGESNYSTDFTRQRGTLSDNLTALSLQLRDQQLLLPGSFLG
jgi:hypothetical protein